jgi:hypothetical protein
MLQLKFYKKFDRRSRKQKLETVNQRRRRAKATPLEDRAEYLVWKLTHRRNFSLLAGIKPYQINSDQQPPPRRSARSIRVKKRRVDD